MGGWSGWEASLLNAIGAPVTAQNVAFLDSWAGLENTQAGFNPLATTQTAPGSSWFNSFDCGNGNTCHVQNYPDPQTGISALAQTIQSGYSNILTALRSGNPFGADLSGELSTWSGGGYTSIPQNGASPSTNAPASSTQSTSNNPAWWDVPGTLKAISDEWFSNIIVLSGAIVFLLIGGFWLANASGQGENVNGAIKVSLGKLKDTASEAGEAAVA